MSRITERKSNFELLRILAMFFIVACHVSGIGITNFDEGGGINKIVAVTFYPCGLIGVALFFMLTGYFLVGKKHVSLLKVVCETFYYAWILAFLLIVLFILDKFFGVTFYYGSLKTILREIIVPISSGHWWFVTSYCLLMIFVPYINQFLEKLNKAGFTLFLGIVWFFWYTCQFVFGDYSALTTGFFFFLLGQYFRLYAPVKKSIMLNGFLAIFSWAVMVYTYLFYVSDYKDNEVLNLCVVLFASAILLPVCAWTFFSFFACLDIKNNVFINTVSATTFGIYLIHTSNLEILFYKDILKMNKQFLSPWFPLFFVADICILFVICSCIDYLRFRFFEPKILAKTNELLTWGKEKFYK